MSDIPILGDLKLPAWTSWTPVLTAATNPTLGTGSSQVGKYLKLGSLLVAHFQITFGTSGVAAGSGTYTISLPVAAVEGGIVRRPLGMVHLFDQSATRSSVVIARLDDSPWNTFHMTLTDPAAFGAIDGVTPWTWAASDAIRGQLMYEVA